MNVLLIGDYPPPYGGIAIHVKSLTELFRDKGYGYIVINIGANRNHPVDGCLVVNNHLDFVFKTLWSLKYSDILHLHTNGHNKKSWLLIMLCGLLGVLKKKKSILTVHSGLAPDFLKRSKRSFKRIIFSISLKLYSRIICVNNDIKRALIVYDRPSEKYVQVPAFISVNNMQKLKNIIRLKIGKQNGFPTICSVALFSTEYGIEMLIEAVQHLKQTYPDIKLVIIGGGERSERYFNLEEKSGLGENIVIYEQVEHPQCLEIISESNLFVRPTFADGDSISVREALAMGIPVLASNVVKRPDGVVLFRTGNKQDLISKISFCIENYESVKQDLHEVSRISFSDQIIDIYKKI